MSTKKLAIFDLDGTLLNTIADLAAATNQALDRCGYPTHPEEAYYKFVGNGINKLFERALPEAVRNEENVLRIRSLFVPYYNIHNADYSRPYDGMVELLEKLQQEGVMIAVASNKYQAATERLVPHFFPTIHFVAVLGQRDGIPTKPDPTIVHDILKAAGCTREEAMYIGDSDVDMMTAKAAEVESIAVTWGFRSEAELKPQNPAHIVHRAEEIATLVLKKA